MDSEVGASPMIGVFILVGLIVVMFVALGVFVSLFEVELSGTMPMAKIEAVEAKGGLLNDSPPVNFSGNWIILSHTAGNPLDISRTKIQIKGYGETQDHSLGKEKASPVKGDILVEYTDLSYDGKLASKPGKNDGDYSSEYHGYEFHNPELSDGFWSAGEQLTLNGQDSKNPGDDSTVRVYMNGIRKTDNNWRFSKDGQITISVMSTSNQILSVIQTTVKLT